MKQNLKELKAKLKQENKEKILKAHYKRKFERSLKANNFLLRTKVNLQTKNEITRIADKKRMGVSTVVRQIIERYLEEGD